MIPPAALLTLIALFLSACGGDDSAPEGAEAVPGDASPTDVEVIDAWATALTEGDIDAAAGFFALPSVTENGPTLRLETREDARLFNAALPCGAVLVEADGEGEFTTATFRLTERPGAGSCGPGTGGEAQTAFVIKDGKITEWRRVTPAGPEPALGESV